MRFVIDTNIIISALIRESITRKIIIESPFYFFTPGFAFDELKTHLDPICKKRGLSKELTLRVLDDLSRYINTVDFNFFSSKIEPAKQIIGRIDEKDIPFIALALSFENDGIWTQDKHFLKQKEVKIWRTEDILKN